MLAFVIAMAGSALVGGAIRLWRWRSDRWDEALGSGLLMAMGIAVGVMAQIQWVSNYAKGGAHMEPHRAEFLAKLFMTIAVLLVCRAIAFAPPRDRRPRFWATAALVALPIACQWLAAWHLVPV